MLTIQCIAHFGSLELLQQALGVDFRDVEEWGVCPPVERQWQCEVLTGGVLRAGGCRKCLKGGCEAVRG